MQKEMNCINQQIKSGGDVDWSDVCYTDQSSQDNLVSPAQEHQQEVNTALDAYDSSQPLETNPSLHVDENVSHPAVPVTVAHPSLAKQVDNFIHHKEHEVTVGTELSHIIYRETGGVREKGMMYGVYGSYTFRPKKEEVFNTEIINMYRIDGKISFGSIKYSADTGDPSTSGRINNIPDYLLELRAVAGYDYYPQQDWQTTPYLGIGYRRLSDDSSGKQIEAGAHGYGRVSNYVYMPIGLEISHQLDNSWRVGATGEFDLFLWGEQESDLTDIDPVNYADLYNRQQSGFGLRASMQIMKMTDKYNFIFEPFVRYWHIKSSDINVAISPSATPVPGYEPNNNSTEVGGKFGVQF